MKRSADWKGRIKTLFNWRKLKWEEGRWCFKTDCCGEVLDCWFEPLK